MNPLQAAQTLGYGKEDILKYLSKANPQIAESITKAMGLGYTAEQVMDYFSKSMAGAKVNKKISRQVFDAPGIADITNRARNAPEQGGKASQLSLVGGLAGAGAGLLTGGPIGAAIGAASGYKSMDKLVTAYQDETIRGGKVPFGEFVKNLAVGTGLAGMGAATAKPLMQAAKEYLSSMGGDGEEQSSKAPDQLQTQPPEVQQAMTTPAFGPKEAFDIVKNEGLEQMFGAIQAKTPEDMLGALKHMIGQPRLNEMAKKYGKPIEEIVGNAFMFTQVPPESQQAPAIDQMGAPQIPVEEVQAKEEVLAPEQPALQQGQLDQRNVKPIDMGEGDESLMADVYNNIFAEEEYPKAKGKQKERSIKPMEIAQKSSSVRGAQYDEKTNKLRIVFGSEKGRKGGGVYEYDNVEKETFEKITGGKAKPITEGSNRYGIWFTGKDKSIGAALHKTVKSDKEKYPYTPIAVGDRAPTEKQILESDRSFIASEIFAPFGRQRERGRSLVEAKSLKEMMPLVKDMDDDYVADMLDFIKGELKRVLKNPPTISRLKKELEKELSNDNLGKNAAKNEKRSKKPER